MVRVARVDVALELVVRQRRPFIVDAVGDKVGGGEVPGGLEPVGLPKEPALGPDDLDGVGIVVDLR